MSWRNMIGSCVAVLTTGFGGAQALAQNCPPGVFNYGPPVDPEIAYIVIDHYGPTGPLIAVPEAYERAERDVGLIREAFPVLASVAHVPARPPSVIFINAPSPFSQELVCANLYYQVVPTYWFQSIWIVDFPAPINQVAMAGIYAALPGVLWAEPDAWVCSTCCYFPRWHYEPRPNGTWRWTVHEVVYFPLGCGLVPWFIDVTQGGVVSLACYPDCTTDGQLTVADFGCFQTRFVAADPEADCNASGTLTVADFGCFQTKFVAGCA